MRKKEEWGVCPRPPAGRTHDELWMPDMVSSWTRSGDIYCTIRGGGLFILLAEEPISFLFWASLSNVLVGL